MGLVLTAPPPLPAAAGAEGAGERQALKATPLGTVCSEVMAEYDVVCLVRGERVPVTVCFDSTVAYLRKTFAAHYGVAPDRPPRLIWRGALLRDLDVTTEQPIALKDVGIVEEGNAVQVSLLPDSYDPEHHKRLQVCFDIA